MIKAPLNLKKSRILITNDDGIHGEGLQILLKIAKTLADDVWIVAPDAEQSGASHSLTLTRPIRYHKRDDKVYTVDGTPTDCMLIAINHLLKDHPPDLVLSGVNAGSNLGEDVTYSGTIAAAMEATLLGVPAIALSQHINPKEDMIHWETACEWAPEIIEKLIAMPWDEQTLMNINFPAYKSKSVKGIHVVRHGKRDYGDNLDERFDPRGRRYFWIGTLRATGDTSLDTDVGQVFNGAISITPLSLELTNKKMFPKLKEIFSDNTT